MTNTNQALLAELEELDAFERSFTREEGLDAQLVEQAEEINELTCHLKYSQFPSCHLDKLIAMIIRRASETSLAGNEEIPPSLIESYQSRLTSDRLQQRVTIHLDKTREHADYFQELMTLAECVHHSLTVLGLILDDLRTENERIASYHSKLEALRSEREDKYREHLHTLQGYLLEHRIPKAQISDILRNQLDSLIPSTRPIDNIFETDSVDSEDLEADNFYGLGPIFAETRNYNSDQTLNLLNLRDSFFMQLILSVDTYRNKTIRIVNTVLQLTGDQKSSVISKALEAISLKISPLEKANRTVINFSFEDSFVVDSAQAILFAKPVWDWILKSSVVIHSIMDENRLKELTISCQQNPWLIPNKKEKELGVLQYIIKEAYQQLDLKLFGGLKSLQDVLMLIKGEIKILSNSFQTKNWKKEKGYERVRSPRERLDNLMNKFIYTKESQGTNESAFEGETLKSKGFARPRQSLKRANSPNMLQGLVKSPKFSFQGHYSITNKGIGYKGKTKGAFDRIFKDSQASKLDGGSLVNNEEEKVIKDICGHYRHRSLDPELNRRMNQHIKDRSELQFLVHNLSKSQSRLMQADGELFNLKNRKPIISAGYLTKHIVKINKIHKRNKKLPTMSDLPSPAEIKRSPDFKELINGSSFMDHSPSNLKGFSFYQSSSRASQKKIASQNLIDGKKNGLQPKSPEREAVGGRKQGSNSKERIRTWKINNSNLPQISGTSIYEDDRPEPSPVAGFSGYPRILSSNRNSMK